MTPLRTTVLAAMTALATACATPPAGRPSIRSGEPIVSYRIDGELHPSTWRLDPELRPDVLPVDLEIGESAEVCFVTDVQEFCRRTAIGQTHDLDIVHDGVAHWTRIEGRRFVPAAVFSDAYRAEHAGKIIPLVPEVYELVNVAIALTETAREDRWLVYKQSDYYERVMEWFAEHLNHPFVLALEEQLAENRGRYARLKMNGYAFEYDEHGEIRRSAIYDRTGFTGDRENALLPFFEKMRAFSRDTDFRAFFARERPTYDEQVRFFVEELDLEAMLGWLGREFPDVDPYDTVKIVFSPLVGASQSVTWFEQGGFRELQPHLNFPYQSLEDVSQASNAIYRGNLVFTELNHGYINPTANRMAAEVTGAVTDLPFWVDERARRSYGSPLAVFNEYMNWGLIALRYLDRAPPEDHEVLLAHLDASMGEQGRGFLQFSAFRVFLVDLYQSRPPGATVADLYPAIVEWFAAREAAGAAE
jgi:hypothetical protein